jgi:branched-chain amino acid transport system substrate-binding protein
MKVTRRALSLGGAGLAATASGIARPAIAQSEPIRVGWLAALTGPSSAPAIGFDRGVHHAVDAINAAGGVRGRKIELLVRDTQGDPTKAVNAAQEMISRARVHAIGGRRTPGESLATTPIMARAKMPDIHPCFVDSLIDPASTPTPSAWRPRTARSTTR